MASANVELVRSIYAAWERGEFSSAEWAHPEIEFGTDSGLGPLEPVDGGVAGMATSWRNWLSAWEDFHAVADEYRELDDERILVLTSFSGRGKGERRRSGRDPHPRREPVPVRAGKVTRLVLYASRARALADLGLAPEID